MVTIRHSPNWREYEYTSCVKWGSSVYKIMSLKICNNLLPCMNTVSIIYGVSQSATLDWITCCGTCLRGERRVIWRSTVRWSPVDAELGRLLCNRGVRDSSHDPQHQQYWRSSFPSFTAALSFGVAIYRRYVDSLHWAALEAHVWRKIRWILKKYKYTAVHTHNARIYNAYVLGNKVRDVAANLFVLRT
jgi:hypothetical protein